MDNKIWLALLIDCTVLVKRHCFNQVIPLDWQVSSYPC